MSRFCSSLPMLDACSLNLRFVHITFTWPLPFLCFGAGAVALTIVVVTTSYVFFLSNSAHTHQRIGGLSKNAYGYYYALQHIIWGLIEHEEEELAIQVQVKFNPFNFGSPPLRRLSYCFLGSQRRPRPSTCPKQGKGVCLQGNCLFCKFSQIL